MPSDAGFGMAGLTLRVDRVGGRDRFYADTDNRPVRSAAWARRELFGEVADDADTLVFGGYLTAGGRAWVDDISLTQLGPNGEGDQPARPLTARGTENLVAFGGFSAMCALPSSDDAPQDRLGLAIAGVGGSRCSSARGADALERLFLPIAPTVGITTHRLSPLAFAMLRPRRIRLVTGWYHGWGVPTRSLLTAVPGLRPARLR
jgi:hypothetical protein